MSPRVPLVLVLLALLASAAPAADRAAPASPRPAPEAVKPAASKPAASKSVAAKPPAARPAPNKSVTFSFVCATPTLAFPPKVKEIATRLAREHKADGARAWGDRAVALRLRSKDAPTYFVPLACGATGNCSWGIVTANPAKSIGVVSASVISVDTAGTSWPALRVFSNSGAGETRVETLRLSEGQYRPHAAERAAPQAIERLRSCFDNASCCPRSGG